MSSYTYLEMVNSIVQDLNSGNSEEIIYTLHQTQQSTEVVRIVKETYFQIIDGKNWPHLYKPFQLAQTGVNTPTHMGIPTNVMEFDYIKYNIIGNGETRDKFTTIKKLEPREFMDLVDVRDSGDANTLVVTDPSGIFLNILKDRQPQWWTSLNDKDIIFDSFDMNVDATNLTTLKTQCRGRVYPVVLETNDFIFDLPVEAFSYLLAEAKSVSFVSLNKEANQKAEQQAVTQRRRMSAEAGKVQQGVTYPGFGRRGMK